MIRYHMSVFNFRTLRKKILRSKEINLIDSISLYQTIHYPIQLQTNISLLVNVRELTQPNNVFETKYLVYLNLVFALKEIFI